MLASLHNSYKAGNKQTHWFEFQFDKTGNKRIHWYLKEITFQNSLSKFQKEKNEWTNVTERYTAVTDLILTSLPSKTIFVQF